MILQSIMKASQILLKPLLSIISMYGLSYCFFLCNVFCLLLFLFPNFLSTYLSIYLYVTAWKTCFLSDLLTLNPYISNLFDMLLQIIFFFFKKSILLCLEHLKILSGSFCFYHGKEREWRTKDGSEVWAARYMKQTLTHTGVLGGGDGFGTQGRSWRQLSLRKLVQHRGNKWKLRSEAQERN